MGLFDRLFGKIEEPKIEDVVKEALENIDLSDDSEQTETLESENIEVKEQDGTVVAEENDEDLSEVEVVEEVIETSRKQKSTFKICNIQKKVLLFQIICFDC